MGAIMILKVKEKGEKSKLRFQFPLFYENVQFWIKKNNNVPFLTMNLRS